MNERIRELWSQCRWENYGVNGELLSSGIDEEKFAELIVKECAKHAEHAKGIDVEFEAYFKAMIFGVEE